MHEELRVEELAQRTGVTVDTIRYYQSRGLIDPPRREGRIGWYGTSHLKRLGRIRILQQRGFTLAVISRLLNGELDGADELLVVELSGISEKPPAGPPSHESRPSVKTSADGTEQSNYTLGELAEVTGVPLALLKSLEAEGLLVSRRIEGRDRYTAEDVEASRAGLLLLEWGIPLSALIDLSRRHHQATEEIAQEAVAMFSTYIRAPLREGRHPGPPGGGDIGTTASGSTSGSASGPASDVPSETNGAGSEIGTLLRAYSQLLPAVTRLAGHHFARTLVKVALEHVEREGTEAERHAVWEQLGLAADLQDGSAADDPDEAARDGQHGRAALR